MLVWTASKATPEQKWCADGESDIIGVEPPNEYYDEDFTRGATPLWVAATFHRWICTQSNSSCDCSSVILEALNQFTMSRIEK